MKKRKMALFLALVMLGTVLCGCGDGNANGGAQGDNGDRASTNEIVVGIAQDLEDSLDPHKMVAAGTKEVLFNVFEGLVKPNTKGELIPAVAESYKISDDGTAYTFTLRKGVKFHNGETVTVDDVVYSISRCAGLLGEDALVPALSAVQKVEATDANTVVITLAKPSIEFLAYLTVAIIPKDYTNQSTAPIGTGPFRYVSRTPQDNIVLEKFNDYWGEGARVDKVTYKIYEDSDALLLALNSGSIDLCTHLLPNQTSQLSTDLFRVEEGTMNLVQAVYLNNSVAPFDNEKVRQALSYAVNIEEIMDMTADGHGTPVGSSMYPALAQYYDASLTDVYTYDPVQAKQLLVEAGYPNGFEMTIKVPSNYQPHMDAAEVVAEELRAVGVQVTIQPVDWSTWLSDVYTARNFQATLVGVDASNLTASAMLSRFVSTAGNNFMNYNNSDYDALYAKAQACTDVAEQTALYKQMEKLLTDTAANVYLQDLADLVAINTKLDGLQFYPLYVLDLSTIYYVK
jgi:peptide/nickel transport system substrate-binding protein